MDEKKTVPSLKQSAAPKIGKAVPSGKPPIHNPFLNYSSSDMSAIGAMQSNHSVNSSGDKKLSTARESVVGNSASSLATNPNGKEKGSKQQKQQRLQQNVVERKKDQDRNFIFS